MDSEKCYAGCDEVVLGIAWRFEGRTPKALPACARHLWRRRFWPEGARVPAELLPLVPALASER